MRYAATVLFAACNWIRPFAVVLCLACALVACERVPFGDDLKDARKAMAQRDWASAEKYLERYLRTEEDPKHRWAAWKELLDVADQGNLGPDWVVDYLETMLVEFGDHPNRARVILRRLGDANETARRYERAARYFTLLLLEPGLPLEESVAIHRRLAALNTHLRRFDVAEEVLQSCLALPVGENLQAQCLFDLADTAAAREHLDEGERLALQVLEMHTASAELRGRAGFIVADIQEQRGQLSAAQKTFESI
ncbi:MAG: hypothetical protein RR317_01030, partial [Bilophila sp.]